MAAHREYMAAKYHEFCAVTCTSDLAALLETTQEQLYRFKIWKPYNVFEVKKASGKSRLIEAPTNAFKEAMKKLNDYLQCSYFFNRTASAYGYIQHPRKAKRKRNIVTNARLHSNKKFMLNVDLEDFFHQVSKIRVVKIFRSVPFMFSFELSEFLAELTTYRNRLPMGSPTSPSLSNFSTIEVDKDLEELAKHYQLTFSRYVDDLTFTSDSPINIEIFEEIKAILSKHSFRMNTEKIRWMGEKEEKTVTGLVLKDKPHVTLIYLTNLEKDLKRLKHVQEVMSVAPGQASAVWVDEFREHVLGKVRFLQMVYGIRDPLYKKMYGMYRDAFNTRPFVESFNWNSFPYF